MSTLHVENLLLLVIRMQAWWPAKLSMAPVPCRALSKLVVTFTRGGQLTLGDSMTSERSSSPTTQIPITVSVVESAICRRHSGTLLYELPEAINCCDV